MRPMNAIQLKAENKLALKNAKNEGRIEILTAICKINKKDGCCSGKKGKGKDCADCAFKHLWELTKPHGANK